MEIVEMAGDSPVVARVSYDLYSPEYKRGMVLEWANSGSSQKGFAREKGIPDTTFSGWVKKWRAEGCPGLDGAEGPSAGPALVEAAPAAGGKGDCSLTIAGARLTFPSSMLPAVLKGLLSGAAS